MGAATWRTVVRAFPSLTGLAAIFIASVPLPVLFASASGPVESFPSNWAMYWWIIAVLPVAAAVVASRWTVRTGRREDERGYFSAVGVATLAGALYLLLAAATYAWIIPMRGPTGWPMVGALPVASLAAGLGYWRGLRRKEHTAPPGRYRYVVGVLVLAFGVPLAWDVLSIAARHSTSHAQPDSGPGVTSSAAPDGRTVTATVPRAGRYGVHRYDAEDGVTGCRIVGPGLADRPVRPLTVPVDYGNDGSGDRWVATVEVPRAGSFVVTCPFPDFRVTTIPTGGAIWSIVDWPRPVIVLLGVLPGLMIIVDTARRRISPDRRA